MFRAGFSILIMIWVPVMISGCTKEPTYEQRRVVEEACHKAGMESDMRGNMVRCFNKE